MSHTWTHRGRFEPSSLTALLLLGDVLAIGVFVAAGQLTHGYHPVADAGRFVGTLVPFLVGWTLVSVAGRLYTSDAVSSLPAALIRTLAAWAVAVVVAQLLRATEFFPGNMVVTFALVSFGVGGVLLVSWRGLVALLA